MAYIFFIPDSSVKDSKITPADIAAGKLKVSSDNKNHFPAKDCNITITMNNKKFVCAYKINTDTKQYTITNKQMIEEQEITVNSILECERTGDKTYNMTK